VGNLIAKTNDATGDQTIYRYDYRNRLVEVDQGSASVNRNLPDRSWNYTASATLALPVANGTYSVTVKVAGLGPNAENNIQLVVDPGGADQQTLSRSDEHRGRSVPS
jgi:hypothetical protein